MEEFEQAEACQCHYCRGERTKYWSISASLIGALLGIIGTTLAAEVRMRRIKEIVPTAENFCNQEGG
uniref:Uncharacterized protein n=1 Tax=Parascaris equorum TaxID=6256 RepID=A0A914RIV1_PAREQ